MCQPQFRCPHFFCDLRRFVHCHVLMFSGFDQLVGFAIHSLQNQQIRSLGILTDAFSRTGVCTVCHLQALSFRSQYHIRSEDSSVFLQSLPLLQTAPEFHGDFLLQSSVLIKSTRTVNHHTVPITEHIVVHFEGFQTESFKRKCLGILRDLHAFYFKRKLRCDHPQRSHHFGKSPGPDQEQRFRALCISHGQKHSRKTTDMIRVKMGKADNVDGVRAPAFFPHGNLGALSAVDQNTFPVIAHHQGGQPSVRQWHHSSGSQ